MQFAKFELTFRSLKNLDLVASGEPNLRAERIEQDAVYFNVPFARNLLFFFVICTMEEVRNVRPSISIRIRLGEANITCSK